MQSKTLQQLADLVGGKVIGDGSIKIESVSTLEAAGPGQITFLSNRKYVPKVKNTRASAVISANEVATDASLLIAPDPYYAFQQIVVEIHGHRYNKPVGISDKASISETAVLGEECNVCDFVTISDNVTIGNNCYFYPGVFIGPDTKIGNDCIFYPNAVIFNGTEIGNSVIVQSNASVGQDGYGFATHQGVHHKIPQIGKVILEDEVEIGAGSAIERGTLDETIIGKGSKIGDQVAIGHGTKVGPHCLLVPQVGVSGSTTLGHHVVIGGQAGIAGHIKIGDMVRIAAQSGISNSIPEGKVVFGAPAIDASKGRRAYPLIEYLPDFKKRIKALERKLEKLENPVIEK